MSEEQYGDSFQRAAKYMADFFAEVLKRGPEGALNVSDSFAREAAQIGEVSVIESKFPPEKIQLFKETLEAWILKYRVDRVSMADSPDAHLKNAGYVVDIPLNSYTIPPNTTSLYDKYDGVLYNQVGDGGPIQTIDCNSDAPSSDASIVFE